MEALEKHPKLFRALDIASRVARLSGDPDKAFALAKKAMAVNPIRGERNYRKVVSALKRKYGGKIPEDLQ